MRRFFIPRILLPIAAECRMARPAIFFGLGQLSTDEARVAARFTFRDVVDLKRDRIDAATKEARAKHLDSSRLSMLERRRTHSRKFRSRAYDYFAHNLPLCILPSLAHFVRGLPMLPVQKEKERKRQSQRVYAF